MLDRYILTFNENINGLRDFIALIGPFIEEHHKKAIEAHDEIVEAFECAKQFEIEKDEIKRKDLQEKIKNTFNGELIKAVGVVESESNDDASEDEEGKLFIAVPKSQTSKIDNALKAPKKTTYQKELLYKNSLIGLLSSVEWFYSQVLHYYYDRHPSAAGVKKKTLTLEDLKTFDTIEDAEKYLIDSKIEEIFRGGFDGWISVLKEEVKLKMPYVRPFYDELVEVYQRRNLLVHNGGIVNSLYISKTPADTRKGVKVGDKLNITELYLEKSICNLHIVFTLIASELWKQLEPEEEERANILNSIVYKNMLNKRWEVGEWISSFIKDDSELKSRVKIVGQLNYWLCRKRRGDTEAVKAEIKKADFTDKSLRYQLAILALTDNNKVFFDILPETLRTKSLEIDELLEFPIFEDMRNTIQFREFQAKSPEFKELVKVEESPSDAEDATIDQVIDELIEEAKSDGKNNNIS